MTQQLPLDIRLADSASFANFSSAGNKQAVEQLQAAIDAAGRNGLRLIYLWGGNGCGKSHLLQASCQQGQLQSLPLTYLPLTVAVKHGPAIMEGFEQLALICLDDLDVIAGRADWEQALFNLYERLSTTRALLVVSATAAAGQLQFGLPDLASRLSAGLTYRLMPLTDDAKRAALKLRAANRGFELPDEVAGYLLTRYPRDLTLLFHLLERIDAVSLARKRRVTIPFIRELEADMKRSQEAFTGD